MAATNSAETTPKKPYRIHRFAIGVNVIIQVALVFFIVAAANYIAFKHFKRWDFSRNRKYALSGQTKQLLQSLQKPLKIYVFFSPDPRLPGGDVFPDLQALLTEYQYAANGKVDVEMIDPFRNLSRARELMAKYKFGNENVVVVDYQGRSKIVNVTDMADYDNEGGMYGQEAPKLKDFKGEQALTSAILDVTENKQDEVCFIAGKGGPEIDSDELSAMKAYLQRQNLKVTAVNLMNVPAVPAAVNALLLVGARYDLTDREISLLRDYWNKQGRIFVALDPTGHTPKLDAFLTESGITPQDDRVLRTMAIGPMTGIVRDVAGIFSDSSPITKRLKGVDTMFMGQTQSLAINPTPTVQPTPLVTAAEGYWGETKYQNMETTGVSYDPKEDISAPLTLAASAEKGALPDQSVSVDTSRMVVVGNSTFLTNQALTEANIDFVLASLNWMLDRKELIGIAPKAEEEFTLNLTPEQMSRIELLVMLVMPAGVAMLGGFMWAQRRR